MMNRGVNWRAAIVVAAAAVVVGAWGMILVGWPPVVQGSAGERPASVTEPDDQADQPDLWPGISQAAEVSSAMARLDDSSRPFTIVILGDATGADARNGWQSLMADWVAQTWDRPVATRSWAISPAGYLPNTLRTGGGPGAPVTIWNASAPGKDIAYTRDHLDAMIPGRTGPIDLLILNHGHNVPRGRLVPDGPDLLEMVVADNPDAALLVSLQNPDLPPHPKQAIENMADNVADLRTWASKYDVATVDAWSAFSDAGARGLTDDLGVDPNPQGYRLWADEVIAALS